MSPEETRAFVEQQFNTFREIADKLGMVVRVTGDGHATLPGPASLTSSKSAGLPLPLTGGLALAGPFLPFPE